MGVPAFRRPKVRNAQLTLVAMGSIAIVLFVGLLAMALISHVHYVEDPCALIGWAHCRTAPQPSLMAQVAGAGVSWLQVRPRATCRWPERGP